MPQTSLQAELDPDCADRPCGSPGGPLLRPAEVLLELIYGLLIPLLSDGGTDPIEARAAAIETIGAYDPATQSELLKIAQIIAFSLTALDSLRLSMLPDLSVNQKLRLRGNANALNQAAHRNARALEAERGRPQPVAAPAATASRTTGQIPEPVSDAAAQAAIQDAQAMIQQARLRMQRIMQGAGEPGRSRNEAGSLGIEAPGWPER